MDNLFSINQVAFILKVHPLTIRRYIRDGKLKAHKAGGNIRIREADLQEFNKEILPKEPGLNFLKQKRSSVKIFTEVDPIFQLQGKGAGLDID